jgi:hypothetical protein
MSGRQVELFSALVVVVVVDVGAVEVVVAIYVVLENRAESLSSKYY